MLGWKGDKNFEKVCGRPGNGAQLGRAEKIWNRRLTQINADGR